MQREGKGSIEELKQLAEAGARLHSWLKAAVEECGGKYECAIRKSYERCVQKVEQEYEGDYSKLLDVERATGLFEQAKDMLLCLRRVSRGGGEGGEGHSLQGGGEEVKEKRESEHMLQQSSSLSAAMVVHLSPVSPSVSASSSASSSERNSLLPPLRVLRCKDRLNSPLSSGYRDILLNVCDVESGFVAELQLNFVKIAQIKSQSHRFYELIRVMDIKWA